MQEVKFFEITGLSTGYLVNPYPYIPVVEERILNLG
jgi:hypothetical protein